MQSCFCFHRSSSEAALENALIEEGRSKGGCPKYEMFIVRAHDGGVQVCLILVPVRQVPVTMDYIL